MSYHFIAGIHLLKQPSTLKFTPQNHLKFTIKLTCIFLGCGMKPENMQTLEYLANSTQKGLRPGTPQLSFCEAEADWLFADTT